MCLLYTTFVETLFLVVVHQNLYLPALNYEQFIHTQMGLTVLRFKWRNKQLQNYDSSI